MARYIENVETPMSAAEAFAYVADLRNLQEWDPGVSRSEQIHGEGVVLGAKYRVIAGGLPLTYEIVELDPGRSTLVVAENPFLRSTDRISAESRPEGSVLTYDARLELRGPLGLLDPFLKAPFDKIGGRAGKGLTKALQGVAV